MTTYEWINDKGETGTSEKYDKPPNGKYKWKRVYSFGVSSISGAGGSPSRPPLREKRP